VLSAPSSVEAAALAALEGAAEEEVSSVGTDEDGAPDETSSSSLSLSSSSAKASPSA